MFAKDQSLLALYCLDVCSSLTNIASYMRKREGRSWHMALGTLIDIFALSDRPALESSAADDVVYTIHQESIGLI